VNLVINLIKFLNIKGGKMKKEVDLARKLSKQAKEQEKVAAQESCIIPIQKLGGGWVNPDELMKDEINSIHEEYTRPQKKKHAIDWEQEDDDFVNCTNCFTKVIDSCAEDDDQSSTDDEDDEVEPENESPLFARGVDYSLLKPVMNFTKREKIGNRMLLTVASFGLERVSSSFNFND